MKQSRVAVLLGVVLIIGSGSVLAQTTGEAAPKIPRTMVEKATIVIEGSALAKGEIAVVVQTSTGQSHEARIGVVAKMKDKEIAEALGRELQFAMSQYLDFKVSGNKVKIDRVKKDKDTIFTVRVVYWSVFEVGFVVEH